MAEKVGFEPTAPFRVTGFQDQLLKPLGHLSKMVTHPRFERGTPWLKVKCSAYWANGSYYMTIPLGAGGGTWTPTHKALDPKSSASANSATPAYLPSSNFYFNIKYMVEGGGFEPPKAQLTDLQSVPFSHSGIPPLYGASEGNRTPNLLITNQLLYHWATLANFKC
jgi:hypothetical protein